MRYGVLLVCCKTSHGSQICVLCGLEPALTLQGDSINNELDCPLLMLTNAVFTAKSSMIMGVHERGNSCKYVNKESSKRIERELQDFSRLEYEHD